MSRMPLPISPDAYKPVKAGEISPTGYLTVLQVCSELHIPEIAVSRLWSLGLLKATKRGDDGPVMVNADDLKDFIARGCPGMTPPPISGAWFDDRDARRGGNLFFELLISALQDAIPLTRPAVKMDGLAMSALSGSMVIKPTAAMLTAKNAKGASADVGGDPLYPTLGMAWAVEALRDSARRALAAMGDGLMVPTLAELYAGPEAFTKAVNAAKTQFMVGQLSITAQYPAVAGAADYTAESKPLRLSIGVRKSDLFTQADLTMAAALAF